MSIIYLSEDQDSSCSMVETLTHEGFTVDLRSKSEDMFTPGISLDSDLLIIDAKRFSLDEVSVYSRIRTAYTNPMMLLIDELDELLQVFLFEHGIDDLLVKPVNSLLVLARIRALLRRKGNQSAPNILSFKGLEINGGLRKVSYQGREISFTSREFDLIWHMARNACVTLDREHLYKAVFGITYNSYDRSIDMYIARIRAKLAPVSDFPQLIKTVRGSGYLFAAE